MKLDVPVKSTDMAVPPMVVLHEVSPPLPKPVAVLSVRIALPVPSVLVRLANRKVSPVPAVRLVMLLITMLPAPPPKSYSAGRPTPGPVYLPLTRNAPLLAVMVNVAPPDEKVTVAADSNQTRKT